MTADVTPRFYTCLEEALWSIFEREDGSGADLFDGFVERLHDDLVVGAGPNVGDRIAKRIGQVLSPDAHVKDEGQLNPIWLHPAFLAPVIACHASLQSALLAPSGTPTIVAEVAADPEAIFGMRLAAVKAPVHTRAERRACDLHVVSSVHRIMAERHTFDAALVYSETCLAGRTA